MNKKMIFKKGRHCGIVNEDFGVNKPKKECLFKELGIKRL